jgi:hypothetical protein
MRAALEATASVASSELVMASRGLKTIGELVGGGNEHRLTDADIEGLMCAVHAIGEMIFHHAYSLSEVIERNDHSG